MVRWRDQQQYVRTCVLQRLVRCYRHRRCRVASLDLEDQPGGMADLAQLVTDHEPLGFIADDQWRARIGHG
jgi:hypothetical protein